MNPVTFRHSFAGTVAFVAVAAVIAADSAWQQKVSDDIAGVLPAIAEVPALSARAEVPAGQYITAELATGPAVVVAPNLPVRAATHTSHVVVTTASLTTVASMADDIVSGAESGMVNGKPSGPSDQKRLARISRMQHKANQLRVWANQAEQATVHFVPPRVEPGSPAAEWFAEQKRQARIAYLDEKAARLRARADSIEAAAARMQQTS